MSRESPPPFHRTPGTVPPCASFPLHSTRNVSGLPPLGFNRENRYQKCLVLISEREHNGQPLATRLVALQTILPVASSDVLFRLLIDIAASQHVPDVCKGDVFFFCQRLAKVSAPPHPTLLQAVVNQIHCI